MRFEWPIAVGSMPSKASICGSRKSPDGRRYPAVQKQFVVAGPS